MLKQNFIRKSSILFFIAQLSKKIAHKFVGSFFCSIEQFYLLNWAIFNIAHKIAHIWIIAQLSKKNAQLSTKIVQLSNFCTHVIYLFYTLINTILPFLKGGNTSIPTDGRYFHEMTKFPNQISEPFRYFIFNYRKWRTRGENNIYRRQRIVFNRNDQNSVAYVQFIYFIV